MFNLLHWLRKITQGEPKPTFDCPSCGAPVQFGAAACRACGSDSDTGWSRNADTDGADLGETFDDFDYDSFLEDEFPSQTPSLWGNRRLIKKIVILSLALLVAFLLVFSGWLR